MASSSAATPLHALAPEIRARSEASPQLSPLHAEASRLIESGEAESWTPVEILTWAIKKYHPGITLSASFGAPEGMMLLDMMHRIEPASRVFVLDTGRLPQATHDLIDRVRDRYDKRIEVIFPDSAAVQEMVREKGMNLFYESLENRQLCCWVRKVEPMRRHLANFDAYVTGLRRDQNVTRTETPKLLFDQSHSAKGGLLKISPLADWSHEQVMAYIAEYNVPMNRLHKAGYPSVGCEPCSRPVAPSDDPRAGRWWWENAETKECGLHVNEQEQGSGI